ncbi:MAG: heavy-metal-associated domain-containing protein [Lentisphaeraceae bacterium]|nr:heavy-metal-associated domain-containing protein [Lentisphaeraceae bacterium]
MNKSSHPLATQLKYAVIAFLSFICCLVILSCQTPPIEAAQPPHKDAYQVSAEVKGMSCPFCVSGVEKHLKKIPGVLSIKTNLKQGRMLIVFDKQGQFDEQLIRQAITKGGFTAGKVHEVTK